MSTFLRVLGFVWAAPLTLLCMTYVCVFWAMGWYKYHGFEANALVFRAIPEKQRGFMKKYWERWGGHAIGNVIVTDVDPANTNRWTSLVHKHEGQHVKQAMRGGIFWGIAYLLNLLVIWWMCPESNPYYSHPMEIDARRAAGQTIDVEGLKHRLQEKQRQVH